MLVNIAPENNMVPMVIAPASIKVQDIWEAFDNMTVDGKIVSINRTTPKDKRIKDIGYNAHLSGQFHDATKKFENTFKVITQTSRRWN